MSRVSSATESVTPVQLEQLTVRFKAVPALRGVSVIFASHQCHAVVGQSGCGKSTLLRCICGLITPDAGRVVLGKTVVDRSTVRRLRQRMGYVIQAGGLFPHMTAWQNVTLMARHLGWDAARLKQRVVELAGLVELSPDQLKRYPAELSGGQRQRVGIIRALMLDPEILLLDEPLAALDPMIRSRLQSDLKQIFANLKKTVILVTHDLAEAGFLGDQIVLMNEGEIAQRGDLAQLQSAPASQFVADFVQAQRPAEPRLPSGDRSA